MVDKDLHSPKIRAALNNYDNIEKIKVITNPDYNVDDTINGKTEIRRVTVLENPYYE